MYLNYNFDKVFKYRVKYIFYFTKMGLIEGKVDCIKIFKTWRTCVGKFNFQIRPNTITYQLNILNFNSNLKILPEKLHHPSKLTSTKNINFAVQKHDFAMKV